MTANYNFSKIEAKWQKIWQKNNYRIWRTKDFPKNKKKIYILEMFPYLSGEGLHLGHVENFTAGDILARYYRMKGYEVLHPTGWDAFGLPTENFAIKNKINPIKIVPLYRKRFVKQMRALGFSYDWSREINTTDPDYYKWTQWMFLQMYKKGLVYKKEAPVNFCPSCKTTIANEEVTDGSCERCHSKVEIRYVSQWHIKITKYADRLLKDLDKLDWPEKIKAMQREWIGKSDGYEVDFYIKDENLKINVFTTRLDTIYGVTFLVLAPEHPLVEKIIKKEKYGEFKNFLQEIKHRLTRERKIQEEINGFFTGSFAIHPLTEKLIPVWISDYVLAEYGTGAIMGVPAHDIRDWKFAQTFNLPIQEVIKPVNKESRLPFTEDGILVNSDEFSNMTSAEAREKIGELLIKKKVARKKFYYKLRDWIFARQRYWGEPIPLVYCPKDGIVPLPEKDLPLTLPKVKYYQPTGTGESPLAKIKKWVKTKCPKCGGEAKRETDTMPQWAGSCWYYLRFIDPKNKKTFAQKEKLKAWLPVDIYIGGAEHAVLHLLYARFWHKFLFDLKLVPTDEPFQKLFNQGLILGPDGHKMSKSRGNVINPDEIIKEYGADSLRMYEMFLGPLEEEKRWIHGGIVGIFRFLSRIYRLATEVKKMNLKKEKIDEEVKKEAIIFHTEMEELILNFKFNVAISRMMVYEKKLQQWLKEKKL
ncbi:MAG: leucine--tRNA ligase, partial [Candidatus Aenigmatarchaeota archaeon]